jgi:hypothetical protein
MNDRRRTRRPHRRRSHHDPSDPYYDLPGGLLIEPSNLTVYDYHDDWVETGILAPDGDMIMRPGREPIGFLHFDDPQGDA